MTGWLMVAVIGLAGVLALVLKAYDRQLREFKKLSEEREIWESRARHKAVMIIEEARDRAVEVLREARIEVEDKRQVMDRKLDKLGEKQLEDYKQVLQSVSKAIEEGAARELGQFSQALETETIQTQKAVGQRIESEYQKMLAEVKDEKARKLAELDRKLAAVIKQVANSVIGKSLTVEDHVDWIVKSLEEAKKRHVL